MSVSVVIPAYNAGAFIDESVQSVLVQDWPADEIIVVNDGSTDRAYDELAALGSNIRVVNQRNRGVSAARNRGCELATSEYVAILDADDVWLPGKLRAQMMHLTLHPESDAVFCRGLYWHPDPGGDTWVRPDRPPGVSDAASDVKRLHYADFLYTLPVASSTMVVKKSVWQAIGGFDETMSYAEDQHFNLRLSRNYHVDLLQMVGMLYRRHLHSATARVQDRNHWAEVTSGAVTAMGLTDASGVRTDRGKVRRRVAQLHFYHGYDHFWRGRLPVARWEFWRAFRKNPRDRKTIAYLLISAIPGLPRAAKLLQPAVGRFLGGKIGATHGPADDTSGILDNVETPSRSVAPR
jgi:glycosyltransferase involved in cell wall biosynthesis